MDLQEIGCEGLDWLDLAQDKDRLGALLGTVMNSSCPYNADNLLNSWRIFILWRNLLHGVS
jgi:hypothetical protein